MQHDPLRRYRFVEVPTFLVAGHETTSAATTWALYALTQNPSAQLRLREELLKVTTDTPSMDELNALPYLEWIVRETLRVHAPVPNTLRVASRDTEIPLDNAFVNAQGQLQDRIRIGKGQPIFIPVLPINRSKDIWGEDAAEFR